MKNNIIENIGVNELYIIRLNIVPWSFCFSCICVYWVSKSNAFPSMDHKAKKKNHWKPLQYAMWVIRLSQNLFVKSFFKKFSIYIFSEREEEKGRQRNINMKVKLIGYILHVPYWGSTSNLLVHGTTANQLNRTGQGSNIYIFNISNSSLNI